MNDINDNPPRFVKRVFTGGVTTEADFGTEFMQVKVKCFILITKQHLLDSCNKIYFAIKISDSDLQWKQILLWHFRYK